MAAGELDRADAQYEKAEATVLAAFRAGADGEQLVQLVRGAAIAAADWNAVAYAEFRRSEGDQRAELDYLTERTEVLSELWRDIADAVAEGNQ